MIHVINIFRRIVANSCGVLLFATFLLCASTGFAADVPTAFDSANNLYAQGKFAEAASAYEQILQSGTVSPALYFNLGNARFKSAQLGRAIAAFRQAESLAPRDSDVRANLQFIRSRVQAPTVTTSVWARSLGVLSLNEWALLTAISVWGCLGLLVAFQFRPALKQSLRGLLWTGAAGIVLCGCCLGAAYSNHTSRTAIVVTPDAVVHNGPLDEAPATVTVHDGAELPVLDTKNDWFQVRVDSQRIGWIKREQIVLAPGA